MVELKTQKNLYLVKKVVLCVCVTVQQQPGDMPYSSQFLRILELYIGDPISHQFGELDMYQFKFACLTPWTRNIFKASLLFCEQKG